jgi:uncharacterized RmlC-like cupin family protein
MGYISMLRVGRSGDWPGQPRGTAIGRPNAPAPGARVHDQRVLVCTLDADGRRGVGDQPGGSGPSSGWSPAHRPHLVLIPPGTRRVPHIHAASSASVYLASGCAEVWHGPGLVSRAALRAGDFIYLPPGTPHLTVNHGVVTAIAVVARADPGDQPGTVVIELPRHLAHLSGYPVSCDE